jgi:hypothetical protein
MQYRGRSENISYFVSWPNNHFDISMVETFLIWKIMTLVTDTLIHIKVHKGPLKNLTLLIT